MVHGGVVSQNLSCSYSSNTRKNLPVHCHSISRRGLGLVTGLSTLPFLDPSAASSLQQKIIIPTSHIVLPYGSQGETLDISRVIKGCWQLSGGHTGDPDSDRTRGKDAVEDFRTFASNGITTFDTADIYGPSESLIGEFSKTYPSLASSTQVLTKLCCFGGMMNDARRDTRSFVRSRIQKSMERLGKNQQQPLDCVQFFWEDYAVPGYLETVQELGRAAEDGLIRSVGVTNFDTERIRQMVDAGVGISLNQVQYSVLDPRPERYMNAFCRSHGIGILAFGTVAGGFLTNKYLGAHPSDVRLNTYSYQKYASIVRMRGGWDWYQSLLQLLDRIAQQYGVGIAEVSTRYILQQDAVAGVIIGARNARHVDQHKALFTFSLSDRDMGEIQDFLTSSGTIPESDVYQWERGLEPW
jgi:aryl-alcohol dehydrogenase-like predicted oxidoreductase